MQKNLMAIITNSEDNNIDIGSDQLLFEHVFLLPNLNLRPDQVAKKELKVDGRRAFYEMLLMRSCNGKLKKTHTKEVAALFGVGVRTIQRLWKKANESGNNDYKSGRGKGGRERFVFDMDQIRSLPLSKRTTLESMAHVLGVSKTFLFRRLKDGTIRRHTSAIKPLLTPANCRARVAHCLSMLDPSTIPHQPKFKSMHNIVHIDEKWFYLTKRHETYYLMADEEDPIRTTQSSKFISKVMFLAAVARPRFDCHGNCTFDGKIGIFPLVENKPALRASKNRPKGTMEVKPIPKVNRDVLRDYLINKVIPAIARAWPFESYTEETFVQQDNCRAHILVNDREFQDAVEQCGLNLNILCQPPNSPDMNILDLGFFRSIQSLQTKNCAKSVVELVAAVEKAFDDFSPKSSNRMFLTLQSCMVEVMKCGGTNRYKIPHMKKNQLEREGDLPLTLTCPVDLYSELSTLPEE